MVLLSVVPICVSVCLSVNTITFELIEISSHNFSGHHPMVERTDHFVSGYTGVHAWLFSVSDVVVSLLL